VHVRYLRLLVVLVRLVIVIVLRMRVEVPLLVMRIRVGHVPILRALRDDAAMTRIAVIHA
jgi:hypothetical protein